jgi:hypothetical protein
MNTSKEIKSANQSELCLYSLSSIYTWQQQQQQLKKKLNSMVWVRERTIPTERPPLVGEVIATTTTIIIIIIIIIIIMKQEPLIGQWRDRNSGSIDYRSINWLFATKLQIGPWAHKASYAVRPGDIFALVWYKPFFFPLPFQMLRTWQLYLHSFHGVALRTTDDCNA